MISPVKNSRTEAAPALYRLLADSAVSRAALGACGFPVALVDAKAKGHPVCYVNSAFEGFFGYRTDEILGKPAITQLFPEDQAAARLFQDAPARFEIRARRKDASGAHVELTIGVVHDAEGGLSHWVLAFADRGEIERLREELRVLRSLAAVP
jgi:PAS domain S-box-containing protein